MPVTAAADTMPVHKSDLSDAQRQTLEAIRFWVLGMSRERYELWHHVRDDYARRFGDRGACISVNQLHDMLRVLANGLRRTMQCHHPCCPCLGADELSLVQLLGRCQHGDWAHARALCEWLVEGDHVGDMLEAATRLATVLGQHGDRFPDATPMPRSAYHVSLADEPSRFVH